MTHMSIIPDVLDRTRLGDPITRDGLTMVPLLRDTTERVHDYLPLVDALTLGTARVGEISENGSVPLLAIYNQADVAVFILDGEELVGAKQNRIVNLSILVPGRQTLPIPVSCVERGRWSYRTRNFHASPYGMFAGGRAAQMKAVTMCMTSFGTRNGDQGRIWRDVDERASKLGATSGTGAMHDAYEARRTALDALLAGLRPLPHQVGAVFAVSGRVVGAEIFETPEIFGRYFAKVVYSYGLDSLVEPTVRAFRRGDAEEFMYDLRKAPSLTFRSVGLGDDLRIEDKAITGGALVVGERLIHCAAFRVAS